MDRNRPRREDVDGFLRHVAANPGDDLPRLIFADWLEERGYMAEGAGQRWAAREGRYPEDVSSDGDHRKDSSTIGGWFPEASGGMFGPGGEYQTHCLPKAFTHPGKLWQEYCEEPGGTVEAEWYFLVACGDLDWDEHGNPVNKEIADAAQE